MVQCKPASKEYNTCFTPSEPARLAPIIGILPINTAVAPRAKAYIYKQEFNLYNTSNLVFP
jgi:hypothetical protein